LNLGPDTCSRGFRNIEDEFKEKWNNVVNSAVATIETKVIARTFVFRGNVARARRKVEIWEANVAIGMNESNDMSE
jgi:hypothetical protein